MAEKAGKAFTITNKSDTPGSSQGLQERNFCEIVREVL
jgi:hypothetical protein